jgi:hypothetical protein
MTRSPLSSAILTTSWRRGRNWIRDSLTTPSTWAVMPSCSEAIGTIVVSSS